MKIIGTVGYGKFLAEIDFQEIDYLAGRTVGDASGYYAYERRISSGTTFNITSAFDQIHRNDQRRKEIETVKATLKAVLAGLEMVDPLIEEPKEEETRTEVGS